jgi:glyoxylase-like metal-dependent hydrolase (beta-lactamase superfamily II)
MRRGKRWKRLEAFNMIFRQLYDPETSTYTYLLADDESREAVLIDTVREQLERDTTLLEELGLKLTHTLETHVHADHVTASGLLRDSQGSKVVVSEGAGVENADIKLADGASIRFGSHTLEGRSTPGHTNGCMTYVCHDAGLAFTGDALLIRGCGRTDFQEGDPRTLYHSVRTKIFELPDETLLYPGHDYKGRMVSTVREEKRFNARLGVDKSEADFVAIMNALDLAYPKKIDEAVPANLVSGLVPVQAEKPLGSVAVVMEQLGRQDTSELWHGAGI